jgi:alkaline phosphatase D
LVGNRFHAPDLGKIYSISNREAVQNGSFYGGEPIWITAEKQNITTATLFWVGASAKIKGMRPTYWYPYDESLSFESRIDTVAGWLALPDSARPQLIMWYYHEPDWSGHEYGTHSIEVKEVIKSMDLYLGKFFARMRKLPNFDQLNFIITSDHGMADLSEDRVIVLDQFIDSADIVYFDGSTPNMNIKVKEGKLEKVYRDLKKARHLFVWKHDSLPDRLHYGTNIRTLDLCLVSYPGWTITTSWKQHVGLATHGFDNDFKDMHAIFYAAGPAFKTAYSQPTFENVDIYPLMSEILELVPAKTDGKLENVEGMLR